MIDPFSYVWFRLFGWRNDGRCRCGHNVELHEHYTERNNCARPECPCRKFRPCRERLVP